MKEIPLTQGKVALVDDEDYIWLSQWKWYAAEHHSENFYAMRNSPWKDGKHFQISMSREILKLEQKDIRQADHKNHNTLDNRRKNLRVCSSQENRRNQKPILSTISGLKGVTWHNLKEKWQARIGIRGERKSLGYFASKKDAGLAYDEGAKKYFGEYAYLNF